MKFTGKAMSLLKNKYMEMVIKSPWVNFRVNKYLHRIKPEEEAQLNLPLETLYLTENDYDSVVDFNALAVYKKFPYQHRKILEYAASFKIMNAHKNINSFCDFASGGDAYSTYVRYMLNKDISIYSIDPLNENSVKDNIHYIKGDTSSIALPEECIDVITCHHSIEHFRGDEDSKAIRELTRILKKGGILLILPIFLCDKYAEISNLKKTEHYDKASMKIRDIFSPFPGWGDYEYFARVYSIDTFKKRILSNIDKEKFNIKLLHVNYENRDIPDVKKNRSLPKFCEKMLILQITKNGAM